MFETAKDGILILTGDTVKIIDANPFMTELLGYSHDEFLDKEEGSIVPPSGFGVVGVLARRVPG